jgi:hypothetical protein
MDHPPTPMLDAGCSIHPPTQRKKPTDSSTRPLASLPQNKSHKPLIIIALKSPKTTIPNCHSEQGRPASLEESGWGLLASRFCPPTQIPRRQTPRNDRRLHYRVIPNQDRQVLGIWVGGRHSEFRIPNSEFSWGGRVDPASSIQYRATGRVGGSSIQHPASSIGRPDGRP